MNSGRDCPACKKDIGLWPVFRAAWPTRVKCPHCKSTLRYGIRVWRTFFIFVLPLTLALLVLSFALTWRVFGTLDIVSFAFSLLLFVVAWGIFEIISAVYLRSHRALRIVKLGSNKPDADDGL